MTQAASPSSSPCLLTADLKKSVSEIKGCAGLLSTYLLTIRDQFSLPFSMFLPLLLDLFFWWYLQELQASRISPEGTGGLAMETLPSLSVTQTNSISEIRLKNHILHNFTACISEVCSTFAHNSSRFFPQS